jgi:hypothetical protein
MKKVLLTLVAATCSAFAQGTTIFMDDFTTDGRFTLSGNASLGSAELRLSPFAAAVLKPGNLADSGYPSTTYSVIQNFGGTTDPAAELRLRGATGTQLDGYYLRTAFFGNTRLIQLSRQTDAEKQLGIPEVTFFGGPVAPAVFGTTDPIRLDVSFTNNADSVEIIVSINDVAMFGAEDTSPYRITHGDSIRFYSYGSQDVYWRSLSVTAVPEPALCSLFLIGLVFVGCKETRIGRNG